MRYATSNDILRLKKSADFVLDFNQQIFENKSPQEVLQIDTIATNRFFNQDSSDSIRIDPKNTIFLLHIFKSVFMMFTHPTDGKILRMIKNFINSYVVIHGTFFKKNQIVSISILEKLQTANDNMYIKIKVSDEMDKLGIKIISPIEISVNDFYRNNHEVLVVNISDYTRFIPNNTTFFEVQFFWR